MKVLFFLVGSLLYLGSPLLIISLLPQSWKTSRYWILAIVPPGPSNPGMPSFRWMIIVGLILLVIDVIIWAVREAETFGAIIQLSHVATWSLGCCLFVTGVIGFVKPKVGLSLARDYLHIFVVTEKQTTPSTSNSDRGSVDHLIPSLRAWPTSRQPLPFGPSLLQQPDNSSRKDCANTSLPEPVRSDLRFNPPRFRVTEFTTING
jgi:hypothetical protein